MGSVLRFLLDGFAGHLVGLVLYLDDVFLLITIAHFDMQINAHRPSLRVDVTMFTTRVRCRLTKLAVKMQDDLDSQAYFYQERRCFSIPLDNYTRLQALCLSTHGRVLVTAKLPFADPSYHLAVSSSLRDDADDISHKRKRQ